MNWQHTHKDEGFHDGWIRGIPPSISSNEAQPNGAVFLGVQQVHKWGQWGRSPSSTLRIIHIPCRMTLPPGSSCQLCPGGRTRVGEWKYAEVSLFVMFFYVYCGFNLHALTSFRTWEAGIEQPKIGPRQLVHPSFPRHTRSPFTQDPKQCSRLEVFNALQTRFGPSKYNTSLKTTLQNATPNCKMKTSLDVLDIIYQPPEPTNVGHSHYKK